MRHWSISRVNRLRVTYPSIEPWLPTAIIAAAFAGFYLLTLLVQ